ncbi:major facilitator superfamily domain-containing protein [Cadophora sp. MPI-SDFR-AT-0126]|nr:major facilitator superfamily domain-containing protein [Leotiomycetes sp. MPI-SDFR-AT-0126]
MSSSPAATSATPAEPLPGSEKTLSSLSDQDNLQDPAANQTEPENVEEEHVYSWGFWAVFAGLIATTLLSALDGAIVATALPTIAETLHLGADYVWVANIYWLTGAVVQPLYAQLSDLWGRRWVFISVIATFTLGSGLCGGASSGNMLIAARAVQGIGAGGINMMVELIICDLVPMRDRSKFLGMIFAVIGLFLGVGPLIGGALTQSGQWRWAFYLNLPIGGVCMVVMYFFLHVNSPPSASFSQKIRRIDWGGISILTASTVAVMYAITYGGSTRPWSAPSVVGPLVIGLLLIPVFVIYEGTSLPREPVTPYHLFTNRTSAAAFFVSFQHAILSLWMVYIFPVYFQAVLGKSQTMSGVYLMPIVLGFPFSVAIGGAVMTKTGRYKPIHIIGMAVAALGCGLASILDSHSSPAMWVFFQLFIAIGPGMMTACLLPATQVKLSESDTALSTGTWAFIRSIGLIWGVTIPAAIFNNRFDELLSTIEDVGARRLLSHGQAYSGATGAFVDSFSGVTRDQVRHAYTLSLARVWQVAVVMAGVAFLVAFLEEEVAMRQNLDTEFGLDAKKKAQDEEQKDAEKAS